MPTQSYARIERLRIRKCSSNRLNQIKHDAKWSKTVDPNQMGPNPVWSVSGQISHAMSGSVSGDRLDHT